MINVIVDAFGGDNAPDASRIVDVFSLNPNIRISERNVFHVILLFPVSIDEYVWREMPIILLRSSCDKPILALSTGNSSVSMSMSLSLSRSDISMLLLYSPKADLPFLQIFVEYQTL